MGLNWILEVPETVSGNAATNNILKNKRIQKQIPLNKGYSVPQKDLYPTQWRSKTNCYVSWQQKVLLYNHECLRPEPWKLKNSDCKFSIISKVEIDHEWLRPEPWNLKNSDCDFLIIRKVKINHECLRPEPWNLKNSECNFSIITKVNRFDTWVLDIKTRTMKFKTPSHFFR